MTKYSNSCLAPLRAIVVAQIAVFLQTPVWAGTATSTFAVTATVSASCQISTPNTLAFGSYSGTQVRQTATISVTCTNTTPYNVGLSAGTTSGATVTSRKLSDGSGHTLNYALYQDSSYSTNWGQTVGTDTEAGTGTGSTQSLTVYGQISAGQTAVPAQYSDTITATVNF